MSSTETAEKLLTKLSGFLISCAMPAVSCPSEASFSVCTRRSCAVRKSSSDFANSRVRASTLSNSRTFSIAITAWSAKVVTNSICLSVNGQSGSRASPMHTDRLALTHERYPYNRANSSNFGLLLFLVKWIGPGVVYSTTCRVMAARPTAVPAPGQLAFVARFQDKLHRRYSPAAKRYCPPSSRKITACSARHSRAAVSTTLCRMGCSSNFERLMTPRTSDVAVCCCSDSERSSVRWRSC